MSGQSGIFNPITAISTAAYVKVGTKRVKDGSEYIYVQSASTSGSIASGDLCYHLVGTNTVTDDVANSHKNLIAGVNTTGTAVTASQYFWALTRGRNIDVTKVAGTAMTAGCCLIGGTTGAVARVAAGTAPTYKVAGWAEETVSAGATVVAASVEIS